MTLSESLDVARFRLQNYIPELIWAILTFIFSIYLFSRADLQQILVIEEYLPLSLALIKLVLWMLLFLLTFPLFESFISFFRRGVNYKFSTQDWPDRWIHHGGIKPTTRPDGLFIKQSASGCLLKDKLWKDFEISFEMKYDTSSMPEMMNFRSLGVLFRAQNLESYFMFEIATHKTSGDLYVKPHVRLLGQWEFVDWVCIDKIKLDDLLKIKLNVRNRKVKFYLDGSLKYEWTLPDRIDFRGIEQQEPEMTKSDKKNTSRTVLEIPFLTKYGMVGFRADWGQGAIVKDIKIKTYSKFDRLLLAICNE